MESVSIIIPVYNKESFVRRCLDSVAGQTVKPHQVILVDDGSTDSSGSICDEYAAQYGWEVYHTENRGVAAARNYGLSKATGNYVSFMDADDAYLLDAMDVFVRIATHGYNVYQFGHRRYLKGPEAKPTIRVHTKGHRRLDGIINYLSMVWNKLYKKSFLDKHQIRFREDMEFGEDEIFNIQCALANNGLYLAPQVLMEHYFDDTNSICRGRMCDEFIQKLHESLTALLAEETDSRKAQWIGTIINRHLQSKLFKQRNIKRKKTGKYDIVYFVKKSLTNEELRYSLRSVEENMAHNSVWMYGGKPRGIKPDHYVKVNQTAPTKWERVRDMMKQVCANDEITEDFWLFNDDFFVLQPTGDDLEPIYDGTLTSKIEEVEARHNNQRSEWTRNLRKLRRELQEAGKPEFNYAVHKPMLINRKKMLEVIEKYPNEPMERALYGNYWQVGGIDEYDMKIAKRKTKDLAKVVKEHRFLSTSDDSFQYGDVGKWLRSRFCAKSRFEV